jgi:threonylcarbamoyladenosine tRNA methylthiotransferase MtaB
MILKRMKRRHLRADAVALCTDLHRLRPDIVLGADLIAGFPTESEEMFENTLKLVEDCGLTYLHVFPYSARRGTPAAKMPQVPGALRKARAARLRAAGAAAQERFLRHLVGSRARVLIEKPGFGRCEHFAPVALDRGQPGEILDCRITGLEGGVLRAKALGSPR